MAITRLSIDGYGARRAGSFSGRAIISVPTASGEHRLATARSVERKFHPEVKKQKYQSIDWSSPIFGEPQKPVIPVPVKHQEEIKTPVDLSEEHNVLSAIDIEIQSLLKEVIAQEGTIAELQAIEQSILSQEAEAERLFLEKKKRLALLLLFMAA